MFFFIDSQNLSLDFFVIVHVIVVLKDCWRKGNDLFWDKCNVFIFFAKFSTTFVGLVLKMGSWLKRQSFGSLLREAFRSLECC